jgi:hypothetical protein
MPSRGDRSAAHAATSHGRAPGIPATGRRALLIKPAETLQMAFTHPESPARCCTIQASTIRAASDSAMVARTPRCIVMQKFPFGPAKRRSFAKYVNVKARFQLRVPQLGSEFGPSGAFFGPGLCHSAGRI